ncbi:MAG: hypothetical protein GF309_13685 [Candidatus Lokiarchaeota archaeon]|nr:hypothetical protein [Candidatus Lokiarchaeota archaeon]
MYAEIVTLTVMIGCIPCILHCYLERGKWTTLSFFAGGFVFGIVRENIVSLMPTLYQYPNHPLYIGNAPLMMGFGWSASFYASWIVGRDILKGLSRSNVKRIWVQGIATAIITAFLSIPVEVAAGAPETLWWIWPAEAITVLWEMPAIVPFGWGGAAFLFVTSFQYVEGRKDSEFNKTIMFTIITLPLILIHLVYVFGVRSTIVLFLGG